MSGDDFLSRWSRRKLASKAPPAPAPAKPDAVVVPAQARTQSPAPVEEPQPPAPLPPVESLTPESDFTPFMRDEVDPGLRRQALRTLFRDERFNVMDGLDIYIADYSKPDPIPPDWLAKLNQVSHLGDCWPAEPEAEVVAEPGEAVADDGKLVEEQAAAGVVSAPLADTLVEASPPPPLKESDI